MGCAGRYVGKTVLITGGSKGIGEGCARAFFEAGANVVICARGEADANRLVGELNSYAKMDGGANSVGECATAAAAHLAECAQGRWRDAPSPAPPRPISVLSHVGSRHAGVLLILLVPNHTTTASRTEACA